MTELINTRNNSMNEGLIIGFLPELIVFLEIGSLTGKVNRFSYKCYWCPVRHF